MRAHLLTRRCGPEILSYSRWRGLFAGVSLEGTSLRPDDDASAEIHGRKVTAREIVRGTGNAVPAGRRLVDVLQKKAARNASTAARASAKAVLKSPR